MIVNCYSETKKLANGRSLKSAAVAAGGHSWRIAFYPNGRLPGNTDFVSVYLLLDDAAGGAVTDDAVHVEARFMLIEVGYPARRLESFKVAGAVGARHETLIGSERFGSRKELERLDFIVKPDRFTIQCDFTVVSTKGGSKPTVDAPASGGLPNPTPTVARSPPPQPSVQQAAAPAGASSRVPPPPASPPVVPPAVRALRSSMSGLPADLGRLLETKQGADVDFEVRGKVFAAHKLVLAARSSVFMADFFGPAKEKATGSHIRIRHMRPDAFEALLHYMYTDSLPATVTNARAEAAVFAQDLLVPADRYNLKDLKSLTENKLCEHNVDASTVLPMLALAEHHQCWKLKEKCLEFIAAGRNTRAVMATDDVEHLARRCPSVVREVLTKILDAREATPSNRVMVSIDVSFYIYALIFIFPLGLCVLFYAILLK
ncbi:hypothetical protein GQ55_2G021000 [Panicum hallii var. hallii]|uniref:BTB domain-containing protein n=1 Tax=Panicum hallii var. hallii TaxID=1504633 RepID=A0A2T7EKM8_9POAL|nr:hypothetical protein GQ55_2G021000 [Panicum hallii var. hallii]